MNTRVKLIKNSIYFLSAISLWTSFAYPKNPDKKLHKESPVASKKVPRFFRKKKGAVVIDKESKKNPRYSLRTMPYEELKKAAKQAIKDKNFEVAVRYFEKMLPLCNDLTERHDIMLEYAGLLAKDNNTLAKAGKIYNEFAQLYPGSSKVEYATFKAIECSFRTHYPADRDQTRTKKTMELAQAFMERTDTFKTYVGQVKEILRQCHLRLFESDLNVYNFYSFRDNFTSASNRLAAMRSTYISVIPEVEPQILNLEAQLAQKQKNNNLALAKQRELHEKYPLFSESAAITHKPKTALAHRF